MKLRELSTNEYDDGNNIVTEVHTERTVSLTPPPPPPLRSLSTLHPSNPFKKKAIVSSYCFLSVTSIVMDWNIALVSLNSGRVPIAALLLTVERDAVARMALWRMDLRVLMPDLLDVGTSASSNNS
jgi:hypothetical protein